MPQGVSSFDRKASFMKTLGSLPLLATFAFDWIIRSSRHTSKRLPNNEKHSLSACRKSQELGNRISREMRGSDDLTPLLVEAACIHALGLLTREARRPTEYGDTTLAHKAESLVRARFHASIKLQDLAQELDVTRYALARAFHAQWGTNVGDYVQTLRLHRAIRLLEETARPIGEIAQELGFSDQSHLTRLCKQRFGTTPGRLRSSR